MTSSINLLTVVSSDNMSIIGLHDSMNRAIIPHLVVIYLSFLKVTLSALCHNILDFQLIQSADIEHRVE